ncbi:MAG: cadherin-like beta sandwich domain-containing protein [Prosthecobacter sp.]
MKLHLLLIPLLLLTQALSAQTSNFLEGESYAWASNLGWLDLKPHRPSDNDGVRVDATYLSGFAWSDTTGWINFGDGTPANRVSYANTDGDDAGVNRDSAGNLSGLAWSPNVGWINFSWADPDDANRPRFSIYSGDFSGFAWSSSAGWINLGTTRLRITDVIAANADLASLTSSIGTPVPTSSGFICEVPLGTSSITLTPTAAHAASIIRVNDSPVVSGTESDVITLNAGGTLVNIRVIAEDGITTRNYAVLVNVMSDTNADLADLSLSTGTLLPFFNPSTTAYSGAFPASASSITVTPTASNPAATITVNGTLVASGSPSLPFTFGGGLFTINIVVSSPSGTSSKLYTLTPSYPSTGKLFFASNVFAVVSGSTTTNADIVINRIGGLTGTIGCGLNSANGTATEPTNYTAQTGTLVTLTHNVSQQHVLIPIAANTAVTKTFQVSLYDTTDGSSLLTTPTTATVVILPPSAATDAVKPVAAISIPANNASVLDTSPVTITGTATDNTGVIKVQVSINNGVSYSDAALTIPGGTTTGYTINLQPQPGVNQIKVRALDFKGNISALAASSFTHLRTLAVSINGPANSGTLSAGFAPTSGRQIGKSYSITATPKPGFVFDGWTANNTTGTGITPASTELPTLIFTMQPSLALTAKFIVNPFTPSVVGDFSGIILPSASQPAQGTVATNATVGFSSVKITTTGAVTGVIKIDGVTMPFTAQCDNTGVVRFAPARSTTRIVARPGKTSLTLTLKADLTGTTKQITGTLTDTFRGSKVAESIITADRHAYNGSTASVPAQYVKAYTARLDSRGFQGDYFNSQDSPQGDGYFTFNISANGTVMMVGKLADDTAVTVTAFLSQFNEWPIYQALYSDKGCIAATAQLDDTQSDTDATAMDMVWFRPTLNTQWYPYGWDEGILMDMFASKYTPSPATVYTGLGALHPNLGNTSLVFTKGLLNFSVTKYVNLTPANLLTRAPTTDTSFTFVPTFTTGVLNGTFTHSDGTKPKWQGVLMQKGANGGGHGYFMTTKPTVSDYLGESGKVSWLAR